MYCINREGKLIANYRKKYLFEVDKKFYQSGKQFIHFEI